MSDEQFPSIAEAFPVEPPKSEELTIPESEGTTDSGTDTATCMASCLPDGMKFKWLSHFPQGHLSVAQGFVGQRMAYFQGSQTQLMQALQDICESHWPPPLGNSPSGDQWWNDCLPVDVQFGAAGDERTIKVFGNIADADISKMLESYNEYRVIATYQLLHLSDPWPMTGKPQHPEGTTLTLQVRGGYENLMVDPIAITSGTSQTGISSCFNGQEPLGIYKNAVLARIRIPLTEYHITCDRLTSGQLADLMNSVPWKCREGTVNCDKFLNEDEGTLLFDSWTLDQTFVPDVYSPRRWRLGCVLKCRQVPGMKGPYPCDCNKFLYPIGWNHDYKRHYVVNSKNVIQPDSDLGWRFIMMQVDQNQWTELAAITPHGNCPSPFVPRFQYFPFSDLFCNSGDSCTTAQGALLDSGPCSDLEAALCPSDSSNCHSTMKESKKDTPEHRRDDYTDIQERVAQIVEEARKSRARKIMRDNERLASGITEEWDDQPRKEIKPVEVLSGGKIVYPE
jgi:hypothetical protein